MRLVLLLGAVAEPLGKAIIHAMDAAIIADEGGDDSNFTAFAAQQRPFWTEDLVYDTTQPFPPRDGRTNYTGLRQWFDGEALPWFEAFAPCHFTQMLFLGDPGNATATTRTYANAYWRKPLGVLPAAKRNVVVQITDFYRVVSDPNSVAGGRVSYDWMVIDWPDVLLQLGKRVLPRPALAEGWYQPPAALDGVPAPLSFLTTPGQAAASRRVCELALGDWRLAGEVGAAWAEDLVFYGPAGVGLARGKREYAQVLVAFQDAFTDVELDVDVMPCEGAYCGAHGHLVGTHAGDFLGEPASGKRTRLRFGMHWHVVQGKVQEGWAIFDFPGWFGQLGIDLLSRSTVVV